MTQEADPVLEPLLGRPCPACALSGRLVAARGVVGACCQRCEGLFVPDEGLAPIFGARRRVCPPTLPADAPEVLLCPICEASLSGVLCAGIAAAVCPAGHGVFFDEQRRRLFERLVTGGSSDVVAAGHVTHAPRLKRPAYLRVFTDRVDEPQQKGLGPWAALAFVAALLAIAYKLGA